MSISPLCKCNFFTKWAQDPDTPVTYDKNLHTYNLVLNNEFFFTIVFCPFCGGHEEFFAGEMSKCECDILPTWVSNPNIPIEHDQKFDEYFLLIQGNRQDRFSFCLSCGGQLSKSKRGSFFTIPSTTEMIEINERLKAITDIDEVVSIFGEPDERYQLTEVDSEKKKTYGIRDIKQALKYTSIAETLILTIQENEDGELIVIFEGKPKINLV